MNKFSGRETEFSRNLVRLYKRASDDDIRRGVAWYPTAHRLVLEWADTYQLATACVACVVAAISPQCEWERNLIIADDVLAGRPVSVGGATHANIDKARRILRDRSTDMSRYFKCGPKVTSFAVNLAGDYDYPTIDTHAVQAAMNDALTTDVVRNWQHYAVFVSAYIAAARKVKRSPAEFQAIIWHTWKRLHPRGQKLQDRRQWHVVATDDGETEF